MNRQLPRLLLLATVAFVLGLLAARALQPPKRPLLERATYLPDAPPLPALRLVGGDGSAFDGTGLRGHWTYVFFGYASCPDVCPTTLGVLAQMRQRLADLPPAQRPRVLLIGVDPARDDPARLRAYVRYFDPAFEAATGDEDALSQAARSFGASYARVPTPGGGYTMDHSAGLFIVGPRGELAATSGAPHDADLLARDYRSLLALGPRA